MNTLLRPCCPARPAFWLLLGTVLALPRLAHAQLVQQYFPSDIPGYAPDFGASVVQREMQDARAQGVEIDSFLIRPSVTEGFGYNSNTLGIPDSGSTELNSSAAVHINSDWTRNAVGASISVDDHRYLDVPVASYTNWSTSAGGSLSLGSDTATLGYSHLGLNLAATDLGVFGVIDPVPYAVDDVRIGYSALRGRISVSPSFEFENFSFGVAGGTNAVSYNALSHENEIGTVTTRYELSTGNAAVLILRGIGAQFDAASINNYTDVAGFAGLDIRSDALVQYRLLVGGETRHFLGTDGATVTSPTAELDALWTPRRTDTITATFARRLDDPESPFARNQTITDFRLQLDHEARRNIFLRAYGELGISDSRTSIVDDTSVDQTQLHFGANATWQVNRHVATTLSYGYSNSSFDNDSRSAINAYGYGRTLFYGSGQTAFTSNNVLLSVTLSE